ncbi:hypothetical protein VU02_02995, partial [Desulfobulbus sp. N2]|nr:hypothetical protein [Desulfobulbus sp. N2]
GAREESCGSVLACGDFLAVLLKTGRAAACACRCRWPEDRVNTHGAKSVINKKEHRFIKIILFISQVRGESMKQSHEKGLASACRKPLCFRIENYKIIITDKD